MNIENISALVKQLQSLGFENATYALLKRISFKPDHFTLLQKFDKGKDKLAFQLFFEKDNKQNMYALVYYDASLQKEHAVMDTIINEIDIYDLEKLMAEIDWKDAFDFITKKQLTLDDKSNWEKEQKVEAVIDSLSKLEKSEDGKVFSIGLKIKYWAGLSYQELFGTISSIKNKAEVSQRFYFFEGQAGISVDEAYRFLQNRQLEKEVQAKRKIVNNADSEDSENDQQASAGGSLLKKKRLVRSSGVKSKAKLSVK